jgi:phosphoglycolate phosphatase
VGAGGRACPADSVRGGCSLAYGAGVIRAFLFDLDGTLVDSLGDIGAAMNGALASLGFPTHPLEAYRDFVGEGVEVLARRAAPAHAEAERRRVELIAAYQRRYAEHLFDATAPYPGVAEALAELRRRGLPLGVLSNKPDAPTKQICAALFPPGTFAVVAGQRPEVPAKPDPQAALALAAELGVPAAEVAFVGDTAVDMRTAVAAGMHAVGVAWGFRPLELRATGAGIVVERADELLALPGEGGNTGR